MLALVAAVQCGVWAVLHRSNAQLEADWETGDTRTRLDALHVLLNRGEPDPARFGTDFVKHTLNFESPPIQEVVFTSDVCKFRRPGLQNNATWFEATEVGEYEAACAELCGNGHTAMGARVSVKTQQDYDRWVAERN